MPQLQSVEVAQRTDPGRDPDKQINEDAAAHVETRIGHLCFVCDGMGGHEGGREAAQLALHTITEIVTAADEDASPRDVLREAVLEANRRVWSMSDGDVNAARADLTCVAILSHEAGTEVAHLGDSRCYLLHQGEISQVTKDHSMVQELVDAGVLTREQAAVHPDANMITRALGMAPEAEVEVRAEPVAHVSGDAFVLCSDGLSDLVAPPAILAIVGSMSAAQAAGQLVDLANACGGYDNITVVILRTRESATASASGNALPTTLVQTPAQPSVRELTAKTQIEEPVSHAPATSSRSRRVPLAVMLGIAFAIAGVTVLGVALYVVMKERHHTAASVPLTISVDAAAASATVVLAMPLPPAPVLPMSVDASVPPAITPLAPVTTVRRKH